MVSMRVEYAMTGPLECDADLHYCGYEDTSPDFLCGPNVRDCYLIHYIHRGEGTYTLRGKTYPLAAGDAFLISPREVVYYASRREEPLSFYWFAYNGRKAPEFTRRMGFSEAQPVLRLHADNRISVQMDRLLQTLEDDKRATMRNSAGQPGTFEVLSRLYALFREIERASGGGVEKPAPPRSSAYIDKAISYIACNYHRVLTVEEIARTVGLERTYFSKLFSRVTGSPPQSYLLHLRVEKALPLLRETRLSVGEIGRGVGLENPYYFSRAFREVMGLSPSAYRRSAEPVSGKRAVPAAAANENS